MAFSLQRSVVVPALLYSIMVIHRASLPCDIQKKKCLEYIEIDLAMKAIFPDLGAFTECLVKPGVVVHTFDPSAGEAEAGGFL